MKLVDDLLKANAIQMNEIKTAYMLLTLKGKRNDHTKNITFRDKKIDEVNVLKFLGAYMDRSLNFRKHTLYDSKT